MFTMLNSAVGCTALLVLACGMEFGQAAQRQVQGEVGVQAAHQQHHEKQTMHVQYLEIVTPEVEKTCDLMGQTHDVTFSDPVPELGGARTATLNDGRLIGVRAPMRESEEPVVRPYLLVDDIDAAIEAAENAGAEIAIPPMEIPGRGRFAIYLLGGIDHGLWEL